MLLLARVGSVDIYAPCSKWMASFFCSRRAIHARAQALDLSTDAEFGGEALSPVEGRVELVKEIDAGSGPYSRSDYIIVVRCGRLFTRILHVRPSVMPGDRVSVGDYIGRFVKSNSMGWPLVPHMHIEVTRALKIGDYTQNYYFTASPQLVEFLRRERVFAYGYPVLKARVVHASQGYTLLKPVEGGSCITVVASRREAVLDGEVRDETVYVGLVSIEPKPPRPVGSVKFLEASIAQVMKLFKNLAVALNSIGPYEEKIRDLSNYEPNALLNPENTLFPFLHILDIYANGKQLPYVQVFFGTLACIALPSRFDDTHVYINVRPYEPRLAPV